MRRFVLVSSLMLGLAAHAQKGGDDDLSNAFGPPPPPKKYQPEHNVPAPVPPEDALAEQRDAFKKDFAAAEKAVSKGDPAVKDQLLLLEVNATLLGGPDRVKVAKLGLALGKKLGDKQLQKESAEKWLGACGPQDVAACRTAALDVLKEFDKAAADKARAADACVFGAEKSKGAPACLDGAAALYAKAQDTAMVARVDLLKTREIGDAKKRKAALLKIAQQTEDRNALTRREALEQVSKLELQAGDAEAAAKAAIQASGAWAMALPPEKKFWARVPAAEPACAAYEKQKGKHACHALEKKILGEWVFRDFSVESSGDQLTSEWMAQVNEHYNVLIQDCLDKEIRRLGKSNNAVLYKIKWLVLDNGSVDAVHSESSDYETAPFVQCIRTQFGYWRYPRHANDDPQMVVQGFTVKSSMKTYEETE